MSKCLSGWAKKQARMRPIQSRCSGLKIAVHRGSLLSWRRNRTFKWYKKNKKQIQTGQANKDTWKKSQSYNFGLKWSLFKWESVLKAGEKSSVKCFIILHSVLIVCNRSQFTLYSKRHTFTTSWDLESFRKALFFKSSREMLSILKSWKWIFTQRL